MLLYTSSACLCSGLAFNATSGPLTPRAGAVLFLPVGLRFSLMVLGVHAQMTHNDAHKERRVEQGMQTLLTLVSDNSKLAVGERCAGYMAKAGVCSCTRRNCEQSVYLNTTGQQDC